MALLPGLAKTEETRALGYVDELRSLLSVGRRKGTQDLLPKLNSLYSSPERETVDRREKPTTVVRPFFSLISATAQDYVADLVGNLEVTGGTLNRFLIVTGEEQAPKPDVKSPTAENWQGIASPLRALRDRWAAQPRRVEWNPEAKELWTEFYTPWRTGRKSWNTQQANLTARIFEHILKIALVYSALAGEDGIGVKPLATAIAVGGWLQSNVLRLFGDVGLDLFSKAEKVTLEIVKRKGPIPRRDLQRLISAKGINAEMFGRTLKTLAANGHIGQFEEETMAGRNRPMVKFIPHDT